MDILAYSDPQLQVVIHSLLDAAGDKDELVRSTVSASLRRLAKKYAIHILQSSIAYRQKNTKLSAGHLTTILNSMERVCEEHTAEIDELTVKQLATYCVDEMTKCSEYLPAIQFPVSNMLVSLGQKNCSIVVGCLVTRLEPDVVPHYTVLHTMANLATANVKGFVPFIKATLDLLLPLLPSVRNEPIRQVFSFALGKFSEAILEYLSTQEQTEQGEIVVSVTKEAFSEEITTAYEILLTSWLQSRESKLVENVVVAVGPMFPLVSADRQNELSTKTVAVLLSLYRRNPPLSSYPVTQCLASIMQAASPQALEPLFDQLISMLGSMVVVSPDYTNPQTVKNHSEVLRCYDRLGCHFPQRTADLLVRQLSSSSERERVEALVVTAHLLSGPDNVLRPRLPEITAALRLLLPSNSVRVKKALLKTIVSLACRGNADDGSDFVEFLVRHCCPSMAYSGAEWEELRTMCANTVYLLSSTVEEVAPLLWSVLLRLLLSPTYDPACAIIARSLAHLASKRAGSPPDSKATTTTKNGGKTPCGPAVFARCVTLLGSPLNNNRGPHLLQFLRHYSADLQPVLAKIWAHKVPQLVNYLEVSQWVESEWEALLLEFVSSSLQAVESEDWVTLVANQLIAQLPLLAPNSTDERAILLKALALTSCCLADRQIINSHLDVMLMPLKNYTPHDSKACARAVGLLSRVHLTLVLTRLDSMTQSELNRRSSRLLGLLKDPQADLEVERARVTVLRCYAEVASQSPPVALLSRLDDGLMAWLISQLMQTKEPSTREAALLTVANMADTLDRQRDTYSENLRSRDQLLACLLGLIEAGPPDPLLLKVTASVIKLPPELDPDFRFRLLRTCFDRVFSFDTGDSSAEDKPPDGNPLIKNLGMLVEEVLMDDICLGTLDDVATMLEPWLVQHGVRRRAAAIHVLRITLQTYYQHMTFGYESPSKFSQAGALLGRAVLRCVDEESAVSTTAQDCARLILLVAARYEGHSAEADLEQAFYAMRLPAADTNQLLAKVVASKLPHYQLSHFADTLLQGLSDAEPASVESVSSVLTHFFQAKAGEMYHNINDILALLLVRLANLEPEGRSAAMGMVQAIAKHHPKAVVNTLLAQSLPLHKSVRDCWKALAADPVLSADIFEQFLRLISSNQLLNDEAPSSRDRPRVAALTPFAAISALREMLGVASLHDLAVAHFAELFALLLTVTAAYIGVTPPVYVPGPGSNRTAFIPNRDAYKINPARVAQDCLKRFLLCARCDSAAEAIVECSQVDLINSFDYFISMMPSFTRAVCDSCGHLLPRILTALASYSDSHLEAQRAAVAAFNAQCVELQCAGQSVLLDSVLTSLLTSLTDPAPLVRRLSLKGLANISCLDTHQKERHSESVLEALIQGLDDPDTESQGLVALQAMLGLSQVLPTVPQAHVRDIQLAVALRVKPFFEKESVELRSTSLRLLGELAVSGGCELPGFQDQVKACVVCLLMHLTDTEQAVVKACKFSLRAVGDALDAEKTKAMLTQHLIDDASLHYQQFVTDLAKLMVEEMTEQIPSMIMTALTYGKSAWTPLRASSATFIGAVYSCSPDYVRERVALDTVVTRLLQQLKDPEAQVRGAASHSFSLLFISPS